MAKLKGKIGSKSLLNLIHSALLPITVSAFITQNYTDKREGALSEFINVSNASVMMIGVLIVPGYILYTYRKKGWSGYELKIKQEIRENQQILDHFQKSITLAQVDVFNQNIKINLDNYNKTKVNLLEA